MGGYVKVFVKNIKSWYKDSTSKRMEKMMEEVLDIQSFKLKGRVYTLTVLHIFNADLQVFSEQLADAVQRAPRMFEQAPVVIDCTALVAVTFELAPFYEKMREFGLCPIGVQSTLPAVQAMAQKLGLPILHSSSQHDKAVRERKPVSTDTPTPEVIKTKIHKSPIRSGQQVVSSGDLVVLSPVSYGAELLAEGNIHIYGALRGRALAGITGDKNARIFCQSLEAELVAIAGIYILSDEIHPVKGPCQIFLQDDCVKIEPL